MHSVRIALVVTMGITSMSFTACDDGDETPASAADAAPAVVDAGPPVFSIEGIVSLATPPAHGETLVTWLRPGDAPSFYAMGRGEQTGSTFRVDFPAVPAAETLEEGLGVGLVLLYADGTVLPGPGPIEASALPLPSLAASGRHAIIYRAPGAASTYPWVAAFPEGYACGVCVDQPQARAIFEPVSCGQVALVQISDTDLSNVCLWSL